MDQKEERETRLIHALLERGREIDLLKTQLALYGAFLTPLQRKTADAYIEALKRGKEDK